MNSYAFPALIGIAVTFGACLDAAIAADADKAGAIRCVSEYAVKLSAGNASVPEIGEAALSACGAQVEAVVQAAFPAERLDPIFYIQLVRDIRANTEASFRRLAIRSAIEARAGH